MAFTPGHHTFIASSIYTLRYKSANKPIQVEKMRTIGHRTKPPITFSASAELLTAGAHFNDEIHRLPTGDRTFIPKGVYRFKNFEEANRHDLDCIVARVVHAALERP